MDGMAIGGGGGVGRRLGDRREMGGSWGWCMYFFDVLGLGGEAKKCDMPIARVFSIYVLELYV